MENFTILRNLRMAPDIADGPGWTDVDENDYYDNGKHVPPQYSSHPTPKTGDRTALSIELLHKSKGE